MAHPSATSAVPLPTWLVVLGSLLLVGHLGVVGVSVLAAQSGPWPQPDGPMAPPPRFVSGLEQSLTPYYLRPLKLAHNYHFRTNRSDFPSVWFEVKLKGEDGALREILRFPDPAANSWVQNRQGLLAQHLYQYRMVEPPQGEPVAAPGMDLRKEYIWEMERGVLQLKLESELRVKRDRPVEGPTDLTMTLARSYVRYLCRVHDAASAQIVRHSRRPLPPDVLFEPVVPPEVTAELIADFGEMTR